MTAPRPMSWCFRIRFRLPERLQVDSPDNTIVLADLSPKAGRVELRAPAGEDVEISDSHDLVVIGIGFASEVEALAAGERWRGIVQKGLAHQNIGADFGDRAPTGAMTTFGLQQLEAAHGGRFLNDVHGLSAFECDPWPRFVRMGAKAVIGKPPAALRSAISVAARLGVAMTDRERLAYDLYSASFSQPSADARFVMLMMAVETLIEPEPRSPDAAHHVERLIRDTRERASFRRARSIRSSARSTCSTPNRSGKQGADSPASSAIDGTWTNRRQSSSRAVTTCAAGSSTVSIRAPHGETWTSEQPNLSASRATC